MMSLLWKRERTKYKTYINPQIMANERNWPFRHCKTNRILIRKDTRIIFVKFDEKEDSK